MKKSRTLFPAGRRSAAVVDARVFGDRRDSVADPIESRSRCRRAESWTRYLRNEEQSLRSRLIAIQRAIEAIEGNAPPVAGRARKQARKAVAKRKRSMTEEQRKAVAERMRNYWAGGFFVIRAKSNTRVARHRVPNAQVIELAPLGPHADLDVEPGSERRTASCWIYAVAAVSPNGLAEGVHLPRLRRGHPGRRSSWRRR